MAAAWRTGLTALVTLITTGIILKGQTDTTTLPVPWRTAVTAAIGAGLALALLGLWHTLAAEVGARIRLRTLEDIRDHYASVEAYQVGQAAAAGRRLQTARTLVAAALGLLLTGVLLTWWAPTPTSTVDPAAYLKVASSSGTICGVPKSFGEGSLTLTVPGIYKPVSIPLVASGFRCKRDGRGSGFMVMLGDGTDIQILAVRRARSCRGSVLYEQRVSASPHLPIALDHLRSMPAS